MALAATACAGKSLDDEATSAASGAGGSEASGGSVAAGASAGSGADAGAGGSAPLGPYVAAEETVPAGCNEGEPQPADCWCTRRCGVESSIHCPRGTGQALATAVGPEGGQVSIGDGVVSGISITIPPGALAKATIVTVIASGREPPADLVDWSPVHVVDFGDAELATSAALDVSISNAGNTIPHEVGLYWLPDGAAEWELLSDSYLNAGFVQASLPGTGLVLAAMPPDGSECPAP